MKTYSFSPRSYARSFKKFNLFVFFTIQIVFIEACQYQIAEHDLLLSDEIRNVHARQLLQTKDTGPAKDFNGDPNFNRYIAAYLESQNRSLNSESFTRSLLSISRTQSYDPVFLLAVIKTESQFNQNAIGSVGEVGLMQIKPDTAEWVCLKNNIAWRGASALKDPEYNLLIGSYYFQYLKKRVNSKSHKYVTAYNMGLSAMFRAPPERLKESDYFERVISNYLAIYSELKRIKNQLGA